MGTICIIFKKNYYPNSTSNNISKARFELGSFTKLNFENTSCIGPENDRESHETTSFVYKGPSVNPPNVKI